MYIHATVCSPFSGLAVYCCGCSVGPSTSADPHETRRSQTQTEHQLHNPLTRTALTARCQRCCQIPTIYEENFLPSEALGTAKIGLPQTASYMPRPLGTPSSPALWTLAETLHSAKASFPKLKTPQSPSLPCTSESYPPIENASPSFASPSQCCRYTGLELHSLPFRYIFRRIGSRPGLTIDYVPHCVEK